MFKCPYCEKTIDTEGLIILYLKDMETTTPTELSKRLRIPPNTIQVALRSMLEKEEITREKTNGEAIYRLKRQGWLR